MNKNTIFIASAFILASAVVYNTINSNSTKKLKSDIQSLNSELNKINIELEICKSMISNGNEKIKIGNNLIRDLIKKTYTA